VVASFLPSSITTTTIITHTHQPFLMFTSAPPSLLATRNRQEAPPVMIANEPTLEQVMAKLARFPVVRTSSFKAEQLEATNRPNSSASTTQSVPLLTRPTATITNTDQTPSLPEASSASSAPTTTNINKQVVCIGRMIQCTIQGQSNTSPCVCVCVCVCVCTLVVIEF
jgi:hypothetical protein